MNKTNREVDPAVVLEEAILQYAPRMEKKNIELMVTLPGEGTMSLNADPEQLYQLFAYLLEYSLRFTDPGGRVEAAMYRTGRELRVNLSDSAYGVYEETLLTFFDGNSRVKGDSIMELSICRDVVEMHGGRLGIHPSLPEGFMVEVMLPLVDGKNSIVGKPYSRRFSSTMLG